VRLSSSHVLLALALGVLPVNGQADDFCTKQFSGNKIRWIVPNSAGGSYDIYSRVVGPDLAARLGAVVQFDNKPGAGGRIGADQIKRAKPDGLTVGIVSGTGLLALSISGETDTPDMGKDFTILGRVDRPHHIWAGGGSFKDRSLSSVLTTSAPSMVFGTPGPGSVSFISIALPAHLLGIKVRYVSGYKNSRATKLAALRGEVEAVSHNFESTRKQIDKGDLVPLLQLSDGPITDDTFLQTVPWLGGDAGLAVKRAQASGQDVAAVQADADAVLALLGLGRIIVGPAQLDPNVAHCLRTALERSIADSGLRAQLNKLGRQFDPASAQQVSSEIQRVTARSARLRPVITAAIASVRR